MQWVEVKVVCEKFNAEEVPDLIADLFYDLGLQGVVMDDPRLQPDEGWGPEALGPPAHYAVTGYFPADDRFEPNLRHLKQKLHAFETLHHVRTHLALNRIDEQDWAESWKAFFEPLKVSHNIIIKPTWKTVTAARDDIVVDIDPGMAFGTGTHPTTVMCIRLLQKYLKPQDRLLDIGTGSGILMATAAKLGAGSMLGVDKDPLSIRIARENLAVNGIAPQAFQLVQGHLADAVGRTFDIVVANLLTDIIVELLSGAARITRPGGIFICSGIYSGHLSQVLAAGAAFELRLVEALEQEDWSCLAFELPEH
jgi:ribosomal protein L11 methyltransferase